VNSHRSARTPRFFHDGPLQTHSEMELSKKASHHMVTVVRTKLDADIQLFNGDGYNYVARLIDTGQRSPGKRAKLLITDKFDAQTESPITTTLVQAISRGDKMDQSIRQSVELGVNHIQPVYSRHSVKELDSKRTEKKMEHWQNIIVSACEQSGRAYMPSLATPLAFKDWLSHSATEESTDKPVAHNTTQRHLILSPVASTSLSSYLETHKDQCSSIGIIIGPETGFDEDEIKHATDVNINAVSVGPRVLRTETAGPACIAVVQSLLGDIGDA